MASDDFMPIPAVFWDSYPDAKRFLISYPRSGSRWMKLIFADLNIVREGGDPVQVYQRRLSREIGEGANSFELRDCCPCAYRSQERREEIESAPRVFRAHSYEEILERKDTRVFYVFRRPDRMLESYEKFAQEKDPWDSDQIERVRASFAEARLREWVRSIEGVIGHARALPNRVRVGPYEEGKVFSLSAIEAFLQHMEFEFLQHDVEAAVGRFRSFIGELNHSGDFAYVRGGATGGVAETSPWWSIDEATRNRAESLHREALALATC